MWEDPGPGEIGCRSERPPAAARHRQFSLYIYGRMKVGRNAEAFLENAAGIRWYRTLSGGIYSILKVGRNADAFLENAAGMRWYRRL